ncbi:MAG: TadE/TadG family type IV pilus assembly protein [Acidimicrobiia bacterium]
MVPLLTRNSAQAEGGMGIPQVEERKEKGATLVEAAIVYGLLFLALFAVLEFGLGFKNWLSVSHAAREGARAGATYGDNARADMQILREIQTTLAPASLALGIEVKVFEAGTTPPVLPYRYTPGSDCSDISPESTLGGTCCDWTPCPDPWRVSYVDPYWLPATRDVSAPFTDRIAVQVLFTHEWVTGFFAPDADFTTTTEFQIEPQVFSS